MNWTVLNKSQQREVHGKARASLISVIVIDARAGIRTRVGGMKTHYDGPSYTTRATACPPTTR